MLESVLAAFGLLWLVVTGLCFIFILFAFISIGQGEREGLLGWSVIIIAFIVASCLWPFALLLYLHYLRQVGK